MAILPGNHLLAGLSGKIGQFVLKQVKGKTVITSVPDRSQVKLSEKQLAVQARFKEAVAYAKAINDDAEKKRSYMKKLKKGETVYQYAVKEFYRIMKEEV